MSGVLLLSIIYLAFISLGLPDSLLGVAWPVMRTEFGADLEVAGWLFMTIAGGTIISSLFSGKILNRFETSHVTAFCAAITASSLLGFYVAPSLIWLFLLAIPLGLGAGVVDAALNHFVATRYKAHHMNWLHCFWGVGERIRRLAQRVFDRRLDPVRSCPPASSQFAALETGTGCCLGCTRQFGVNRYSVETVSRTTVCVSFICPLLRCRSLDWFMGQQLSCSSTVVFGPDGSDLDFRLLRQHHGRAVLKRFLIATDDEPSVDPDGTRHRPARQPVVLYSGQRSDVHRFHPDWSWTRSDLSGDAT